MNESRLFRASCLALVATAMTFAIRGDIMGDFEKILSLDKTHVGAIAGAAFWGFGLSILFGGPLCDLLGMNTLLRLAAAGHIGGTLLTIVAPSYPILYLATLIVGVANGLVEAAVNPLVATIYSRDKTAKLTLLHAWFPGGIVIGGVLAFLISQMSTPGADGILTIGGWPAWQVKMLLILFPAAAYAYLFLGVTFPPTEREAAGVPFSEMFRELARPLFLVVWLSMWLTAATELGFGQWVSNIFNDVMQSTAQAGVLVLVWTNGLMYVMRQFFGNVSHRVSPVALIATTSVPAALGLFLFSQASTPVQAFGAAALVAIGVAFWWPTMLGITSERFPKGGALALAVIGATGSVSTAISGPVMGWMNDAFGPRMVLAYWAILPCILFAIFGAIYLADKSRGGYRVERIQQHG